MQLQFVCVFQSFIPLIIFKSNEKVNLVLEKTLKLEDGSAFECDVYIVAENGISEHRFAIEMKCYRTLASSGKSRGAINVFVKEVYEDIEKLENYRKLNQCDEAFFLVVTDYRNIVFPSAEKSAKYWDYDISNGFELKGPKEFTTTTTTTTTAATTTIGGNRSISIKIEGVYAFSWKEKKQFLFLELENNDV